MLYPHHPYLMLVLLLRKNLEVLRAVSLLLTLNFSETVDWLVVFVCHLSLFFFEAI